MSDRSYIKAYDKHRLDFSSGNFNDLLTLNLFQRLSFKIVEFLDLGSLMQLNDYLES